MTTVQTAALWTLILGLAIPLFLWNSHRLEAQDAAFEAYEACVADQYGTTPSAFYQMHGVYPECSAR